MEARSDTDVQIVRHTWVYGAKDKSNHLVAGLLQSSSQDSQGRTVLSGKANDQRNRGRVALGLFSNFERARSSGNPGELVGKMTTLSGPFLVSSAGDEG